MATTPATTSSSGWPAIAARLLRSVARSTAQVGVTRLLHAAVATVATAVAVLAMINAATRLYHFAVQHESGPTGAVMLTATVLGLYTIITASAWRARLHGRHLSRLAWLLWWIVVGVGLVATATAAASDSWVARAINAVPMAALAALAAPVTYPQQS